jgi:hypothetical protein
MANKAVGVKVLRFPPTKASFALISPFVGGTKRQQNETTSSFDYAAPA